jgi:hypothetical protein
MRFIQANRVATRWNKLHGVGTPVIYESVKGDQRTRRQTKTIGEAFVADSGTAVIFVEGVRGYVALSHIIEITE